MIVKIIIITDYDVMINVNNYQLRHWQLVVFYNPYLDV